MRHAAARPLPQYKFTATPMSGSKPVVALSTTTEARFTGLTPATQYTVRVTGKSAAGTWSPASNTLSFVTPSKG